DIPNSNCSRVHSTPQRIRYSLLRWIISKTVTGHNLGCKVQSPKSKVSKVLGVAAEPTFDEPHPLSSTAGGQRFDDLRCLFQCFAQLCRVFASAAGVIGTAAAFPPDDRSNRLDDFACLHPGSKLGRNRGDQGHGVVRDSAEND